MKGLYDIVQIKELEIAFLEALIRGDRKTADRINDKILVRLLQQELRKGGII